MYSTVQDDVAAELVFGAAAGFNQFGTNVANNFRFKDDYIPQSAYQIASGMVREDLADNGPKLPKILGGASLGQIAYDAITTTANMAPSILASYAVAAAAGTLGLSAKAAQTVGSYAGNTAMGLSAAGGAYQQALNEGYDKNQARGYSILVGASEMAMEKLLGGISAVGGNALGINAVKNIANADTALKAIAKRVGGSALSEFGEEYLQEVLDPVFSNIMLKTDKEVKPISAEALYSGILGMLTGAFMEAPSAIYGEAQTARTGRKLKEAGGVDSLAKIGNTFAADTVAYKLAGKVNENTGAYTIGQLFNEIGATLTEQNVNEIAEALMKEGVGEIAAKKYAKAFAYVVEGGAMPDSMVNAIEADTVLAKAAREVLIDSNTTWNQRTQGYNEVLRKLAMDKVTGKKSGKVTPANDQQMTGKLTAEESTAVENENAPSGAQTVEGRDIHTGTQEAVSTDKIKSITKDGVVFAQEDGSEVSSKDVAYADAEDGLIFEAFTEMRELGTNAANEIISIRRKAGGSGQLFANVMRIAYEYGYANLSEAGLLAKTYHGNIPTGAVQRIYQIGKEARAAEDARRAQAKKSIVGGKTEVYRLTEAGEVKQLGEGKEALKVLAVNERKSVGVKTAQFLQKIGVGGNYYFIQSYTDKDGNRLFLDRNGNVQDAHNGMYYSNGDIYIDLNAEVGSSGITLFTISHELAHFVQQWNAEKYKVLADFLAKHYAKNGTSAYRAIKIKQQTLSEARGTKVSFEEAYHEFVADSLSTMFSDGNIYEKLLDLKKTDKSVFDKIRSYINKLAQKAKAYYSGEIAPTTEGQFMQMQSSETIDQLQQLFADALVGASENYRNAETQKNTDQEVGVQYSANLQNTTGIQMQHAYMKPFADQLTDFQNGNFPERDVLTLGGTPEVLKKIGLVSLPMTINQKHINDALNGTYKGTQQEKLDHTFTAKELAKLPEKLADPVAIIYDKRAGKANASESNIDVLVEMNVSSGKKVLAAVQVGGNGHINGLRIDTNKISTVHGNTDTITRLVDAINENQKGNVAVFYLNNDKTTKVLQSAGNPIPRGLSNLDGFIHSITDPGSPVKMRITTVTESQQFKRWFGDWQNHPENASKVVNEDGTPKVVYHGSYKNFSVFDGTARKHSKAPTGTHFFTDNIDVGYSYTGYKQTAKPGGHEYQGGTYPVYLNIRNPYYVDFNGKNWSEKINGMNVNEHAEYAKQQGYDGLIAYNIVDEGGMGDQNWNEETPQEPSTDYVVFDSTQIKSATDNIGTFDGNNPDIRYSNTSSEPVSNRSLLANAMESLAKTDLEKKKLTEYKAKIDQINAEEQKLSEVRAQIKELSFAKGPRDKEKLRALRDEAIKLSHHIGIYDKQLLRLEASKPLQNVLDREKAKAYQRGKEKGEAALKEYKQKAMTEQEQVKKRYEESRKRSVENRNKTAMRHKIRKTIRELDKLLNRGSKERNVKEGMRDFVAEALASAEVLFIDDYSNEDIIRNGVGCDTEPWESKLIDETQVLMQRKKDLYIKSAAMHEVDDVIAGNTESFDARQKEADKLDRKIAENMRQLSGVFARERARLNRATVSSMLENLAKAYKSLGQSDDLYIRAATDEVVYQHLLSLSEQMNGATVKDMTLKQLKELDKAYTMVLTTVQNANKVFREGRAQQLSQIVRLVQLQIQSISASEKDPTAAKEKIAKWIRSFSWNELRPVDAFERLGSDSFTELFWDVIDAQGEYGKLVRECADMVTKARKTANYAKWDMKAATTFTTVDGKAFKLTLGDLMSVYAYSKREQAYDHMTGGGFDVGSSSGLKGYIGTEETAWNTEKAWKAAQDFFGWGAMQMDRIGWTVISIANGYTVERPDLALISDLIAASNKVAETISDEEKREKMTPQDWYDLAKNHVGAICNFMGAPAANIIRDVEGAIRFVGDLTDDIYPAEMKESFKRGFSGKEEPKRETLYEAIVADDTGRINVLKKSYVDEDGKFNESAYSSAIRKALREYDPRIQEAAQAYFDSDLDRYNEIFDDIFHEDHFEHNDIHAAIMSEVGELEKKNAPEEVEEEDEEEKRPLYSAESYFNALLAGNKKSANLAYDRLVEAELDEGYLSYEAENNVKSALASQIGSAYKDGKINRETALKLLKENTDKDETDVKKWDFEIKFGYPWSGRDRAYRKGVISESKLIDAIMDIEGESQEAARAYIKFIELASDHSNLEISADDAADYYEFAQPAKISLEAYMEFKEKTSALTVDKDKNGQTINDSKKKKVMDLINAMSLSVHQKDALYYAAGYKESTIDEAPWH